MKIIEFNKTNTIFNQFISEIRNVAIQKDQLRFRRNCERMGEIFSYEISKTLDYSTKQVITPLGTSDINTSDNQIVLATILRAGLPLHQGMLNYFDGAENAFISAFRKHTDNDTDFTIESEYLACPDITNKTVLLSDPMLASGASILAAYKALLANGTPKQLHVIVLIASQQGIDFIQQHLPKNITLWVGAIDQEMNDKSYIIPGLGDAGDLAFGEKM